MSHVICYMQFIMSFAKCDLSHVICDLSNVPYMCTQLYIFHLVSILFKIAIPNLVSMKHRLNQYFPKGNYLYNSYSLVRFSVKTRADWLLFQIWHVTEKIANNLSSIWIIIQIPEFFLSSRMFLKLSRAEGEGYYSKNIPEQEKIAGY